MSAAPLKLVIGFSPGSASDDIAHMIAGPLSAKLGRVVTIERIAGDNGARGALAVARAPVDGSTLFIATLGTHALAPQVRKDLPYDAQRDFEPVSLLTQSPMLLACHPGLPVHDTQSFIAHARAHPGELAYGTSAIGGAPHLAAELFQAVSGVQLRHARYDETQKLYADLEAGRIAVSFNNIMSMLPRCNAGRLRALGVTAATRSAAAPQVPTLAEAGVVGGEVSNWVGLVAPRGTPQAVVEPLSRAVAGVMRNAKVAAALNAAGITPCGTTANEFSALMATELSRWKSIATNFAQA